MVYTPVPALIDNNGVPVHPPPSGGVWQDSKLCIFSLLHLACQVKSCDTSAIGLLINVTFSVLAKSWRLRLPSV